jgi:endonuclease/exonuclease/phosphatase family metal-dependent hydrolase
MRLISLNILNPYHAVKWKTAAGLTQGQDNWLKRRELIVKVLKSSNFAVACLQEVSPANYAFLSQEFKGAGLAIYPAPEDSQEGLAIFYDPNKVTLVFMKTFVVGRHSGIYADFNDKETGQNFRAASIHLKGYFVEETDLSKKQASKQEGFDQLQGTLEVLEKDASSLDYICIAGDVNEDEREQSYPLYRMGRLVQSGYKEDGDRNLTEWDSGRKIDWIFVKELKSRCFLISSHIHQEACSDHKLVGTDIISTPKL